MRFRKLRIAWSAACGIACVLLIALWMRSYQAFDRVSGRFMESTSLIAVSYAGRISAISTAGHALSWTGPRHDSGPILAHDLTLAEISKPIPHFTYRDTDVVWPEHTQFGFGWIYETLYSNIANGETGWSRKGMSGRSWSHPGTGLIVPHWFAVLAFAALATIPWLTWSWRFSLRTLLIATTLVAILLALVVYTVRSLAALRAEERSTEMRAAAK